MNSLSSERRDEQDRDRSRTIYDDGDMSEYFRDVGTQVEEGDIISDVIRTGVAETPPVSYAQVFATAILNTEPHVTFVLPSLQSALRCQTNATESTTRSVNTVIPSTAGLNSCLSKQSTTDHALVSSTSYSVSSSSATSTFISRPEFIPKTNTVPDVINSGVPRLPSYPRLFTSHSSVQSDIPSPREAIATLGTSTCAHSVTTSASRLPGSELQKSEKFLLTVPPDVRCFNNASPYTSPSRDKTCDVTSSENKERNEKASTSSNPTDVMSAHEQHPLQLIENESARDNSDGGASSSSENPLTRHGATSAPSAGLDDVGRVFESALLANNSPETVEVGLPLKRSSLETCSSPVQTQDAEIEPAQHSGRKRRRSSLGIAKERKRRSGALVNGHSDSRLRDKLHQRVWDGTTFKVEEVKDIDFTELAFSRRGSRREPMGIIGNTPSPVHGNRRRRITAEHNVRGPIAGDKDHRTEVPLPYNTTSRIRGADEKSPEETGETSHQSNATEEMSAEEFAGETSHAQNEATSKSTENCSRSENGDDTFYFS